LALLSKSYHSLVLSSLILRPSMAKLVLVDWGAMRVADLARRSAVSCPRMPVWPGAHLRELQE
jgi:hypothetical protein